MLEKYWPTNEQVANCIRTEAEELDSYVLQVVHEPMSLSEVNFKTGVSRKVSNDAENELLEHLKIHSRPIPILGDAGSGKSHLIRLLHVQLNNDPDTKDWIVKRIRKSSSLKQVLETLLDGMEGDVFEELRGKIKEVVDKRKPEEVADLLIVFMSHRLQELLDSTQERIEGIKRSGGTVDAKEKEALARIRKHASSEKLPSLLGDPNFKERLTQPGCCIYNIAKRLMSGSTESEIIDNDYTIKEGDLNLESVVLDDLSGNTKAYIRDQQLNSNADKRQEVVDLLNEILSDSCRVAFQQFFGFGGGQFQELFEEIRRELMGNTLVILVEDMAAITAIEKDLIDSLIREGIREGEQSLCTVKSAIAVTTGYEGYQRRRDTITSRSGDVEWHIDRLSGNNEEIYQRVQDFCGRYLNASRYELSEIKKQVEKNNLPLHPWHDTSLGDLSRGDLDSFGESDQMYPLFPYNKASLKVLTEINCRNRQGELEFNPRTVLGHILIPILRDYRTKFLQGTFPPVNFLGLAPSVSLQTQIRISDQSKLEQSLAAVAFWGYEASDKGDLVRIMPPSIASVMGLEELAQLLGDTTPTTTPAPAPTPTPKPSPVPSPTHTPAQPGIANKVDQAFKEKHIDQDMARDIRNELFDILKSELSYAKKWSGIGINILSHLKSNYVMIHVPFSTTKPLKTDKHYASFGSEKIFSHNIKSLKYRQFIVAALRLKKDDKKNQIWSEDLYEDYCRYQNFAKDWADKVIPEIVAQLQKEVFEELLNPAAMTASIVHPTFMTSTNEEKLNMLCSHSKNWQDDLSSQTGQVEWDDYKNNLIEKWGDYQDKWIGYVAHNDHAISRDIVAPFIKKINIKSNNKLAQTTQHAIRNQYEKLFSPIEVCNSKEAFSDAFQKMQLLITKMKQNDQFKVPEDGLSSTKLINRIKKVVSDDAISKHWVATSKLLKIMQPYTLENFIKAASGFNGSDLEPLTEILGSWKNVYELNLLTYGEINRGNDSESRTEKEEEITRRLQGTKDILTTLIPENEVECDAAS